MDPYQATVLFYERPTAVQDWQSLPPTIAGHRAQRNADPLHYQEHWSPAIEVVDALAAQTGRPGLDGESQLDLCPAKPHTQALAEEVTARFDLDPADAGGYRDSAVDSGGHPAGLAVDFMTYEDRELGDRIVDYLVEHADRLSVDYIIWRQAIWRAADPEAGWQPMEDRGDDTANHYDHPHVNVLPSPSTASPVGGMGCLLSSGDNASGMVGGDQWVQPADGPITSRYGPRWGAFHAGIDFGAPCGTPIYAASSGLVTYTGNGHSRYGLTGHVIVVDHGDGIETTYNHMYANGIGVRPGQQVRAGQVIGAVGNDGNSTGCHLHFGVYANGQHTDPAAVLESHGVRVG